MKNTPNTPASQRVNEFTNVSNKMHRSSKKYGIAPTSFRITKSDIKNALLKLNQFDQTLLNTLFASMQWRRTTTTESKKGTVETAFYTLSNGIRNIYLKVKLFPSGNFSINGMPANATIETQLAKAIA